MQRYFRIVIVVALSALWLVGSYSTSSNAAASSGCLALNFAPTETTGGHVFDQDLDLLAGETIGAVVTNPVNGGASLDINGVQKSSVPAPAGGTLSYTVPADGTYLVQIFTADSEEGLATFDYFCSGPNLTPCDGGPVPRGYRVYTGTAGNDRISTMSGNSVIFGLDGDDVLSGGSGNDFICGGPGNDLVSGGSGTDYVDGGQGTDRVDCGSGNDECHGQSGDDTIDCGSGNDQCFGEDGTDRIYGGTGTDACYDPDFATYKNSCEGPSEEQPPPQGDAARTRGR